VSNEKTVYVRNSSGILGAVGVVLVILKLAGVAPVAAWSWWLVTLPFWFWPALFVAIFAAFLLGAGVLVTGAAVLDYFTSRKR
jgi:hypothetical protein